MPRLCHLISGVHCAPLVAQGQLFLNRGVARILSAKVCAFGVDEGARKERGSLTVEWRRQRKPEAFREQKFL